MNLLSVVIPVYNEEKTLRTLVEQVKEVPINKEIILVDDGSSDNSPKILEELQKENPDLKVVIKGYNSGKGATLVEGFKHASGDYVIVQDADLEYDPNDYLKMIDALSSQKADVIYGSRFSGNYEDMSSLHYFGNKFLTLITNVLYGVLLTDMETCYKLVPTKFVKSINIKSKKFNFEPEITAKILKSGLRIKEIPINYKGRSHADGKKITWKDGISALSTLIWFRFFN